MKEYSILKFLDLFEIIFKKMDIDYPAMRKIIQVKLLLDSRRISTVMQGNTDKKDQDKNNFYKSLIMYFFIGLIMIPFILLPKR